MDLGLKKKVALVLGSSQGLGKSVAQGLAREGAKIIICGRNEATLKAAAEEISEETGAEILPVQCDLSVTAERESLVNSALEKWGRIDILVTNTGGPPTGKFEQFELNDWEEVFNQLFISAVDVIRRVLPGMKERGNGRILTITSIAVKQPVDNLIASNAIRSGILGFMKSLSNEVGTDGITVNNIMPGWTLTERLKQLIEKNPDFGKEEETIPMRRFATPEEFAAAALFLVSEPAGYITGVSLPVDGGWIKGS